MNVTSVLQCGSESATVSWVESPGAVAYTVLAQECLSGQHASCRSNATSCQLNQLQCGNVYNLTVLAEDATCNSTGATRGVLITAPCSPSIQSSDLICGNSSALLSWTPVVNAKGYTVNATDADGRSVSCSSPSGSCTLTDLLCSETYEVKVTAQGSQCDSAPGPSANIITAPCAPAFLSTEYSCGSNTAVVSWSDPVGQVGFFSHLTGNGYQDSCNTANTTCVFENLPCGLDFYASIQAQGDKCNSSISVSKSLQSVSCPPANVSVTLLCSNSSALATWVASSSVSYYNVTMTSQNGHTHHCHTNSTSCQVPYLHCGETYSVTVTPHSQSCTGIPSAAYSFRAGVCAPSNITISQVCENSTILWSPVPGAEMFTATATASGAAGHTHTCMANFSNSCGFTDLDCGENYSVTVATLDRGCWSKPSSAVQLTTVQCPPANLNGSVNCETNSVTLTWSPVTGATYTLQWKMQGSTSPPSEQQTTNTSLPVSDLLCGETYVFLIAAQVSGCRSRYSLPVEISTGPCQPTNFTALVDCGTNNGNFSWSNSSGAGFYTVQAVGDDGHIAYCSSDGNSCAVKLHCGRSYSATLVASTDSCNSTKHTDIYFKSAPCLLDNVVAELDCNTNEMNVNWSKTSGSDEYTAWAISTDGHRVSCNSTSNHCSIQNLRCGKIYEVAVTSKSIDCEMIAGSDYKVQSAPCGPEDTTAELICNSNIITVKWDHNSTSQNFTAKATSAAGVNSTCDSAGSSCSFLDLSCGQLYSFTVTGHTNVCISDASPPTQMLTAPCMPTSVSAELNCTSSKALISWRRGASVEATAYNALATSSTGHNSSCTSMGASCYIDHLVCGQVYSVSVEAIHSGCPGPVSPPTKLSTGPCVPVINSVHYNVSAAWVSWGAANDASSYFVQAIANQNQLVTCDTNDTFCSLNGLQCGQIYNVTVTAQNQACVSMPSELSFLMTAPCPPTNVQANFSCEQLSAAVSWQQSDLAMGYVAYLDDLSGHSTSCVGAQSDTSCVVSNLICGTVYNVWVKALGVQYNSSDSSVVSLTSAPCQPSSISAVLDCEDNRASVTWRPAAGAQSYVTVLTSTSGHSSNCSTNLTSCQLSSLQCGEPYTVTVTSHGQTCYSAAQMAGFLTTAPCLPSRVNVRVSCESDGDALVFWSSAQGATNVSLEAVVGGSLQSLCTTQQNSCNVTGLSCSASYNLSLIASNDQCSITAPTYANLTTRPCPPQHVAVSLQCGSSTAILSWEKRSDVELYTARAIKALGGQVTECNSTGSSCQFSSLDCGEIFNFTVRAHSQGCWSQESSMVLIQTEPCQTRIVSAQALCQSEQVQISWTQAAGVVRYLVTAAGNLGGVEIFNTTQPLLSATLPCGQHYNVTVEGQGSKCSTPSNPVFFTTGPCAPSSVATSTQCELNVGSVSWSPSDGAESYVAIATSLDGHTHKCLTNATSCTWSDLHCGEEYTVAVSAKAGNCTSLPSNSTVIYMDPCTPTNVSVSVSCCDNKVVLLSWDGSHGATHYLALAETGDKSVSLVTNVSTAHFSELICGQNYSLTITPHSQNCAGSSSAPNYVQAWPCTPSGISASQDCLSGNAVVSWQAVNGTDNYTANMETDSGLLQTCTSEANKCSVTALACGHNFSVSVTAHNQQCSVTSTQTTRLQSVPCIPQNVSVALDCADNTAAVNWSPSRGAIEYSVISNSSCQVSDPGCLVCGSSYSVQVVSKDDKCSSIPSQPVVFYSSPCPPQNLSAQLSCSSNDLTISWDAVRDSDRFLVSLTSEVGGARDVCNTTHTTCSSGSIACGSVFTVQVASVRGGCLSELIQTQSIQSAPCQPQGVQGSLNCVTNSARISWDAVPGAESYFVSAVDGANYSANCTASTNTTCEVKYLACGALYNFTVTAKNKNCDSSPSASISLQTAPCNLTGVTAFPQCHNSSILVVWDHDKDGGGTTVYTVTAEASDLTLLTCNNTGTSCYIHGARCDLRYTIIVAASSEQCSGLRSPPYRISMEPCPLRDMMVNASCDDHSALVSWTPSPVAEAYLVVAMAADGHKHTCNTTSSNCSLSQLHCEQQYTVSVTAGHENCSSKASHNATLNTGPCQQRGLSVEYHCDSLAAVLSWTPSSNAKEYYGSAQAGNGGTLYCYSSNATCTLEGLKCGATYNVSVQASDGTCNSSLSAPVQTGGAPCPPGAVEVHLMPMELEIQLLHFSWTQISCGETEYLLSLTGNLLGDNQEQVELSSYWTNVTYFEIPLPCGSYYAATLQSRNAAGASAMTVPLIGTTAPCPPSGVMYSGNSSLATVSWNASVFANTYTIYDSSVVPKIQLCSTKMLACSLFNITSSSLQITASNAAGESQPVHVSFSTHGRRRRDLSENVQVDGAPLIEVTQPAATVVYLQWPQEENATFYDLRVNKQGSSDGSQKFHVYGETIILSDLSPDSTYCFSILAVKGTMSGPESKPVCVQTGLAS
ncbi:serine-rich adhesin for platelets [Nothobranchius furzeri]